jgi:poly-gamma-glutamate capsule biosynthesis protein CapA/YwtB (metallophosphatase superfamily)
MANYSRIVYLVLLITVTVFFICGCRTAELSEGEPVDKELPGEVEIEAPEAEIPEISLLAVGDVMLARKLDRLIREKGMDYPFLMTREILSEADIAFANLESPLSDQGAKLDGKGIWFRGNPENKEALVQAGFDVISLANNHALDYDAPALLQTIELLEAAGIKPVGGGENIDEARRHVIIEREGIRVAFLAYSEMADIVWSYKHPRMLKATEEIPGIAPLVVEQIIEDIEKAKEQADYVFLSLHWGVEYKEMPEDYQIEIAHQLIDAGADVILGHHPHCLQGVEVYRHGLIAYSLGNFVFDQNWSDETREGLLLKINLNPTSLLRAELIPIFVNDGQPVVAAGERGEKILSRTKNISERLGTSLELTEGKAVIFSRNQEIEPDLEQKFDQEGGQVI